MNFGAKLMDRQLGHRPVSTGSAIPDTNTSETMKAIVWHGKEDIRYEVVPKPMVTEPEDVVVKMIATTVCGTDLHLYKNEMLGMESGDVIGHEAVGVITAKGTDVKWDLGTRVLVSAIIACGRCEFCQREEYSSCDTTNPSRLAEKIYGNAQCGNLGCGHLFGGYWGCQAEFIRVPFANLNCLPVPDDIPDEKAVFLTDVLPTAYHGCELGEVKKGDTVAIWGMGPIGLACVRWCQILGCSKVIGIDNEPYRLEAAMKLGATAINFSEQDPVSTIFELTGNRGVDVAIEAAGFRFPKTMMHKIGRALMLESDAPEILTECCKAVRKCGHVSVIGDYGGCTNNFPIGMIQMKHLHFAAGIVQLQRIWKMAMEKVRSGEFDPTFLVTHRLTLADLPQAYAKFDKHQEGMLKVFARPGSA